ncbi:MAG TPA: hypothetical protein VFI38_13400 [Candidatus Acidoferrum sp.]|nr:hypothetical protein [Candidatus Acidoferrum sp.]
MAKPNLWGLKKLASKPYPIAGASAVAPAGQVTFDLKDYLQNETIGRLFVRVKGNLIVAGAGAGVATGRDNPESLITGITARHNPALGVVSKNSLTARGIIQQSIFDRGYSIHGTAIADAAGTTAVDYWLPLNFKMPGSVNPIEWGLPMALFTSYQLQVNCGGREQLFTGGVNTFDPTGLVVEIWVDYDSGVAGSFHLVEEFEQTIPVTQTQPDLQLILERGFQYTHLLFIAQTANAKDNTLINGITVQSAGRVWTPQGDKNAQMIQNWNRETHVNNAAESLVGTYFIPALRDGMASRGIDASQDRVEIKLDVTLGGGPSQVVVRGRRIIPQGLSVAPAKAA